MDTGSSWTFVKTCDSKLEPIWKTKSCPDIYFNSDLSATFNLTEEPHEITYGNNPVSGLVSYDNVKLEG